MTGLLPAQLVRRDKYQKKIREYWVETGTEGTYQKEDEAALKEGWEAEGSCGDELAIGGPNPDEPLTVATEDSADSESEEEDKHKAKQGGKPRGSAPKKADLEEEAALEAKIEILRVLLLLVLLLYCCYMPLLHLLSAVIHRLQYGCYYCQCCGYYCTIQLLLLRFLLAAADTTAVLSYTATNLHIPY